MSVRSSTLQRAVDYLRPNAGTDKPVQSAERTAIEGLFRWAHESDEDVFDDEEVSRKGIRVETLSVEDEESEESARPSPEFFRPMSTNELLTYHMSDEDEATQLFAGSLPSMMEDLADMDDYGAADFFCVHLAWEFGVGIRSNIPKTEHGFGRSMEKISSWDFREGFLKSIFRPRYLDALFFENDPSFAPVASWTTKDQAKQPHIMLTMRNETVGDDRLLRGELMALTAAICSRMAFHHFKQNAVIPVMLFSFMAPRSGRIIQAYNKGHSLVIRKSRLFNFSTFETAPFQLFLRYLACKPVGYTGKLSTALETVKRAKKIPTQTKKTSRRGEIPSFEPLTRGESGSIRQRFDRSIPFRRKEQGGYTAQDQRLEETSHG